MRITNLKVAFFLNFIKLKSFTVVAVSTLMFGFISNASADEILWASTGSTNANGGGRIYKINVTTGSVTLVGDTGLDKLAALDFDNNGTLYGISSGAIGGAPELYTFDTTTAAPTLIVSPITFAGFGGLAGSDSIVFDASGTLYAEGWFPADLGGAQSRLLTLDPLTGSVLTVTTLIGSGNRGLAGLAVDPTNQLFGSRGATSGGIFGTADLVSVDLTGFPATTTLVDIGAPTANNISDIWIAADGTMYGTAPVPGGGGGGGAAQDSALYTIDPITGVQTLLHASLGIRVSGLTAPNPDVAVVEPGPDVPVFNQANVSGSPNPLTAVYEEVIEGGVVTINCCRVLDIREGATSSGRYAPYSAVELDIGDQIADTTTNPTCAGMPNVGPDKFVGPPWLRATLRADGLVGGMVVDTTGDLDPDGIAYREHELGVCVVESQAVSKGVLFTEEEAENVLGYSLNYGAVPIEDRPFTAGTSIDPPEVDAPFVTRWSAETNRSRSGKRSSTTGFILNIRHFTDHNATKPYLSRMAGALLDSIELERSRVEDLSAVPPVPAPCVDNSLFFLDDLFDLVSVAKKNFSKKGDPGTAVMKLQEATRLALLLTYPVAAPDPYDDGLGDACPGNPKGLLVGRLLALTHATCSEIGEGKPPLNALAPDRCAIPGDIKLALPPLP